MNRIFVFAQVFRNLIEILIFFLSFTKFLESYGLDSLTKSAFRRGIYWTYLELSMDNLKLKFWLKVLSSNCL